MNNSTLNGLLPFGDRNLDFSLTKQQQQCLPTDKDVAFFQEHGWFVTKKVLNDKLIDDILATTEEFYNGNIDAKLPIENCCNWQQGDLEGIRNNEYISFQKKAFRQLTLQPIIGAIAARLMNTKTVRYFQDQLISKEPNNRQTYSTEVGWHTDRSYHSNCTSDRLLTLWIPLHDVTIEHGCLVMVDRSHKWSGTKHLRGFNHNNHQDIEQKFTEQGKEFKKVPILLKQGQISFHHSSMIHGSFQNYSDRMRRAIVINLQDGENRYRAFWNNGKQIHHCLVDILPPLNPPNVGL